MNEKQLTDADLAALADEAERGYDPAAITRAVGGRPRMNGEPTPKCGATITGPIVKDRGRSRPLWRRTCLRPVKSWGDRCYQHPRSGVRG